MAELSDAVASAEPASVETSVPADPPTFNRGALESKVEGKMASIFGDEDADAVSDTAEQTETANPSDAETPGEDKAEVEAEGTSKEEADAADAEQEEATPPTTPSKVNPAAPVIPAAYRRSLKAYQWTDAEIDSAAKADPANFLRTAAKLHETRNAETQRMAELGKQLKAQQPAATSKATDAAVPSEFKKLDIEALKKQYGNEPFIQQLEQVNKVVEFANQVMPWMQQSQQRQQQAELESLGRQIEGYFGGKEMESYAEVYGKTGAKLTDGQLQSRQQVLATADLLISGAKSMGRSMTLDEALTLAHDSVTSPVKEQVARRQIAKQVKARNNAVSLRPNSRTAPAPVAGDRKAIEKNVSAKLKQVFR